MNIFRRSIVRMGNTTFICHGDGRLVDVGNVSGENLIDLVVKMRLPLVKVVVDRATLPAARKLPRSNKGFVFDQPKGCPSNWRENLPQGV